MHISTTQLSIAIAASVWLSFALGTKAMPASSASPAAQVETSPHASALGNDTGSGHGVRACHLRFGYFCV